ncbi:MAG: hypothetical protein J7K32_07250 [Deltaproteobacteria bacterium]|nr:hypothetical protein [Deltaproteobacteria bacterium]
MMKKLFYAGSVIVLVLIIGVVILYSMLGSIIRSGIETIGPKATGGDVQLADVDISLLSGQAGIEGFVIGNPPGFSSKRAFELGQVSVKVDTSTVTKDVILVRNIFIDGAKITWEGLAGNNHKKIMDNIAKFSKSEGSQEETAKKTGTKEKSSPGKKVIIDDFIFQNSFVDIILEGQEVASLKLPDIHLTEIGRNEGGVTVGEAIELYYNEIFKSLKGCVADNHEMLLKNAEQLKAKGEAVLKQGEEDLEKSREAFEKGDIDSAVKGTLKATDKLKGFFNK